MGVGASLAQHKRVCGSANTYGGAPAGTRPPDLVLWLLCSGPTCLDSGDLGYQWVNNRYNTITEKDTLIATK